MTCYNWLMPNRGYKNVSLSIEKAFMGKNVPQLGQKQQSYYIIKPLTISLETYDDIVSNICNIKSPNSETKKDRKHEIESTSYKYLRISKLTNQLVKTDLKYFIAFSQSICPSCYFVNCVICIDRNKFKRYMSNYKVLTKNVSDSFPRFIKCGQCHMIFKPHEELLSGVYPNINSTQSLSNVIFRFLKVRHRIFRPTTGGWQCKACQNKYENSYAEFRIYLNHIWQGYSSPKTANTNNHDKFLFRSPRVLFERLQTQSQIELRNDPNQLNYSLHIKVPNGNRRLIPPLAFLMNHQRSLQFYKKLISDPTVNMSKVKTSFGSVVSRMKRGKFSSIRQHGHNKRYIGSARVIITPCNELEPDECILPISVWRRLDCPRYVLAH